MSATDKGDSGPSGAAPGPGLGAWRCVLLLGALDALAWGLVWAVAPSELFARLGMAPRNDAWAWQLLTRDIAAPRDAGLWQLLAFLSLAHAGFLTLAAWRPRSLGGLVAVPLIGHALGAALWLWAVGAAYTFPPERVLFPDPRPLWALAVHDAVWLPLLLAFLLCGPRRSGRDSKETGTAVQ